jgi:membrane-associated phospholipid phosphatase
MKLGKGHPCTFETKLAAQPAEVNVTQNSRETFSQQPPSPAMTSTSFWQLFTRLGEAQILLPVMLVVMVMLLRRSEGRPLARWWTALLGAAALLTLTTKVAFMGWGWGWAALNFTGISGHAMLASAVYPLLFATLTSHASRKARTAAIATGFLLALAVGISRLLVGVHSGSEVLAGLLLGGWASVLTLISPLIPAVVAIWLAWTPVHAPAAPAHGMVIQLSLKLSGHTRPYTRSDMLRDAASCSKADLVRLRSWRLVSFAGDSL